MQCKRMHGDRGRYLVNMGEKCNLMIPWTKVQKKFHCSYGSNHTQAIVLQFFLQLVSRAFKMSIEISSKQAKQFLTFQIGINFIFLQFILLALVVLSSITKKGEIVAKMASHAIFQYNVLAIDDTHNTWTNMIIKMTILRLLGSSDDKEKIGVARPEGQRIEETVKKSSQNKQDRDILLSPVKPMMSKLYSPVQ